MNQKHWITVAVQPIRIASGRFSSTIANRMTPNTAAIDIAAQVASSEPRSPMRRPKNPAMKAPSSGRKMAATYTRVSPS